MSLVECKYISDFIYILCLLNSKCAQLNSTGWVLIELTHAAVDVRKPFLKAHSMRLVE